jgi:hypothetical protein
MSNTTFTESVVEEAALSWLEALGYAVSYGPGSPLASAAKREPPPCVARWACKPAVNRV